MISQLRTGIKISAFVAVLMMPYANARAAMVEVLRPIPNAIVRENVPVRVARKDLPPDGYVAISIDGQFQTATVIPPGDAPVFVWNTKAPYTTADDPDTKKYVKDGPHTITISVHTGNGKVVGITTVPVRVVNLINPPSSSGVKLAYKWSMTQDLVYQRKTDFRQQGQSLESSVTKFARTIEDADGDNYLLRDKILPNGFVYTNGQPQLVSSVFTVKSKYRSVDSHGRILDTMAPLSAGTHIGFTIPTLPLRRVAIGDSWQTPVELSLDWSFLRPATIMAEGRLEGYEWQDGYPTARIRETYNGPATFPGTNGRPSVRVDTIQFSRIIYFAYNSGRMVRLNTTIQATTDVPVSSLLSNAGAGRGGGGPPSGFGGGGPPPGFGGGGPPPGFGGGGPPPGFGGGGPPPGFGGAGFRSGNGAQAVAQRVTYDITEMMQLVH